MIPEASLQILLKLYGWLCFVSLDLEKESRVVKLNNYYVCFKNKIGNLTM